jgi:type IV secretory pathway VirB10-like protein
MSDGIFTPKPEMQPEAELHRMKFEPKGVLKKHLKTFVYLGAALLVIVAALCSSTAKKTPAQEASAKGQPPQPMLQDNTDNNVQELKSELQAERQKEQQTAIAASQSANDPALASTTQAQQVAVSSLGPTGQALSCAPGQPCPQTPGYIQQGGTGAPTELTPVEQQAQEIAAKDRARADEARFASNIAYARPPDQSLQQVQAQQQGQEQTVPVNEKQHESSLLAPRTAGEQPPAASAGYKRPVEADIDSAVGQPYLVYEGSALDTVLMNRLDGDAAGPVKVLVSNPVYSHDRQHVLIPEGTVVLGEARKIGASGFGQQRRIAVAFHRLIMPDGYSVDLDQFHGLDQIGEQGLKDKVNNHYFEIFGASIALGVIAGAAEISQGGGEITTSGSQAFTTGAAASVSQSANTVLDRFIQIPPTITIREGNRVKVYFTQDMLLPAYTNHTIPQTF